MNLISRQNENICSQVACQSRWFLRKNKRIVYFPLDKSHHIGLLSSGRQEILHSTLKHNILFHMINVSSSSPRRFLSFLFFFLSFFNPVTPLSNEFTPCFSFPRVDGTTPIQSKSKIKKDVTEEIFFLLSIQLFSDIFSLESSVFLTVLRIN